MQSVVSTVLDYLCSVALMVGFGMFARLLYLAWRVEYSAYCDTRKRTSNQSFSLNAYAMYRLDYLFTNTRGFKIYALATATIALIFFGGIAWLAVSNDNLAEAIWTAWTFIADPGAHGDNKFWLQRFVSLALTIGGMVIFAMVIGIISEEIASFFENLKKGKSSVIETGHTLIIGQGDMLIPTIDQIAKANMSEGGGLVVVLTTLAKEELEETITRAHLQLHGTSKPVILFRGLPYSLFFSNV